MTEYAVFKDGKQVSKSHSTIDAAFIEARERGFVVRVSADFEGDYSGQRLANGVDISEVPRG